MALDEQTRARAVRVGRGFADAEANPWRTGSAPSPRLVKTEVEKMLPGRPSSPEPPRSPESGPYAGFANDMISFVKWLFLAPFALVSWLVLLLALFSGVPYGIFVGLILAPLSTWLILRSRRTSKENPKVQAEWDRWRHHNTQERAELTRVIDAAYLRRLTERRNTE